MKILMTMRRMRKSSKTIANRNVRVDAQLSTISRRSSVAPMYEAPSQKSVKLLIMRRKMTRRMVTMMMKAKMKAGLEKMKMNLQTRMISQMMNLRMAVLLSSTTRSGNDIRRRILKPRPSSLDTTD